GGVQGAVCAASRGGKHDFARGASLCVASQPLYRLGSDAVAADDQCHRNESGPGGGLAPEEGQRRHKASPGTPFATGARSLRKRGHDLCPSELTNRVSFGAVWACLIPL